jgi:hypothetical protein
MLTGNLVLTGIDHSLTREFRRLWGSVYSSLAVPHVRRTPEKNATRSPNQVD